MSLAYKLAEGSLQHKFQLSRAKLQMFGGGFGNGKTTSAVIKTLQIAKDYPGASILLARSTYPKLNDTLRKEFLKWCPSNWIKSKNLSQDNIVVLKNGTTIYFRYIAQQGKNAESSTSNLLSATYDLIVVDQIEDPEISEKDFLDLMGRLRGNATYQGDDPTMPASGPRWFIMMSNPTRNWVYRKLVKPMQDLAKGFKSPDLLVDVDTGEPMMELFEGSTYTNKDNLPEDFIKGLEGTYTGQMRTRFLMGEWGAFEGLVYPQYDPAVHMIGERGVIEYLDKLITDGFAPTMLEAYDHGIAKPACYGLGFVDHFGNVFLLDGLYEKERTIEELAEGIKHVRGKLDNLLGKFYEWEPIYADPAVFKRTSGNSKTVGVSVSGLFSELGIDMQRANNDIVSGIAKVQSYLAVDLAHRNPLNGNLGSPRFFCSSELTWFDNEIVDYNWKRDTRGEYEDIPNDRADHAMDMLKYMLSKRPRVAKFVRREKKLPPKFLRWQEREQMNKDSRSHRHAA